MSNMNLWESVCVTAPHAVKPITGKQYKGNSPKPYWLIEQATKAFGPCGIGWGINVVSERFERFGDTESLHVAKVSVWYELDGKRGHIEQMGQTRSSYVTSAGKFIVDEDAPKKSVTDGMVKCLSMLGFAGDIFSGQWDDSKYVAWAEEETKRREAPKPEFITAQQAEELASLADEVNADLSALFPWFSKKAGREVTSFSGVHTNEFQPIHKALEAKKAAA